MKCMYAFFRQLTELLNVWNPNCSIAIGKIPSCCGSSERACIQKISEQNRETQVWMRNEVLALAEPFLNCCAMSNLLLRKCLKEKELQTLGLVSRSVLFYLCASGSKRLQSGSHSTLSSEHSTVFYLESLQSVDFVNK